MLSFDRMIPTAAKAAGSDAIVAAPYPLPEVVCRDLVSVGIIGGYVADRRPEPGTPDPAIAGWIGRSVRKELQAIRVIRGAAESPANGHTGAGTGCRGDHWIVLLVIAKGMRSQGDRIRYGRVCTDRERALGIWEACRRRERNREASVA